MNVNDALLPEIVHKHRVQTLPQFSTQKPSKNVGKWQNKYQYQCGKNVQLLIIIQNLMFLVVLMFLLINRIGPRFTELLSHENGINAIAVSARSKYDFNKNNG
jgi:hypothetical protein